MKLRINTVLFSLAGIISVILIGASLGGSWQSLGQTAGSTEPAMQTQTTTPPAQGTAGNPDSTGVSTDTTVIGGNTVASAQQVTYKLAAGSVSAPIKIPVTNSPVFVMGVQTNQGTRGVGEVTILRISGPGGFLEWTGLDSTAGSAITQGFSGFPGTKIVFIDFDHCVIIEVHNADNIQVHNSCNFPVAGKVKLIW
jgi:hypothetical protein